jgi:hypothetical protein
MLRRLLLLALLALTFSATPLLPSDVPLPECLPCPPQLLSR